MEMKTATTRDARRRFCPSSLSPRVFMMILPKTSLGVSIGRGAARLERSGVSCVASRKPAHHPVADGVVGRLGARSMGDLLGSEHRDSIL